MSDGKAALDVQLGRQTWPSQHMNHLYPRFCTRFSISRGSNQRTFPPVECRMCDCTVGMVVPSADLICTAWCSCFLFFGSKLLEPHRFTIQAALLILLILSVRTCAKPSSLGCALIFASHGFFAVHMSLTLLQYQCC